MLYSDRLVDITDDAIVLKRYYFPFGSRRVAFSEIQRVDSEEPTVLNGKWRLWGTGTFTTWFPLDWRRPSRDRLFFVNLLSGRRRIGFSVENSRPGLEILKQKGVAAKMALQRTRLPRYRSDRSLQLRRAGDGLRSSESRAIPRLQPPKTVDWDCMRTRVFTGFFAWSRSRRSPHNPKVEGSNPSPATKNPNRRGSGLGDSFSCRHHLLACSHCRRSPRSTR